ncbi:DUF58 domain-containing protein [Halorientalis salina]|uniref:DUF58 domain-containing protein n=1 Tax=Halorientalis salina TaxID=2932266 RepID=UPI002022AAE0|nr:DUF58 domain-containing protein [Halorientalis salina]
MVLTLVAVGAGLLAKRPALLLVSALGLVFAAYPWLMAVPSPQLSVDRRLSEANPQPGEPVDVTTTVRNSGTRPVFDLRFVDGVPPALSVVEGTPRLGTALRAGTSDSITYTVEAERGRHAFESATAVVRDPSGGTETETQVSTDTEVTCTTAVSDAPIGSRTVGSSGQIPADQGGSGTEFYQTRAYRRGDPVGRIDWNRYARSGDLSTIEFREEQAATVVLLVDARAESYRGRDEQPHAVADCVAAAQQLLETLLDNRNQVGITAFGRAEAWLPPGSGRKHRLRGQQLLTSHPAFGMHPPDPESVPSLASQRTRLRARLPSNAQLLVFSPLLDDDIVEAIRQFEAEGHQVSVVSPDVTVIDGNTGRTLAAMERDQRLRRLRQTGVTAIDWAPQQSLSAEIDRGHHLPDQ